MFSHIWARALAIASAALLLSACKTFSPDGGMSTVAAIAGQGLNKSVVLISSPEEATYAQDTGALLHARMAVDERRDGGHDSRDGRADES